MPCDTVRTVTVDDKKFNLKLLVEAMNSEALNLSARESNGTVYFNGGSYRHTDNGGQFTFDSARRQFSTDTAAKLKAEYACSVVQSTAKQNGWVVSTMKKVANVFARL